MKKMRVRTNSSDCTSSANGCGRRPMRWISLGVMYIVSAMNRSDNNTWHGYTRMT